MIDHDRDPRQIGRVIETDVGGRGSLEKIESVGAIVLIVRVLARIVDNVRNVLAIELLCAAQGVDLRGPHKPGRALQAVMSAVRAKVPMMERDRELHLDIRAARALLDAGLIEDAVRSEIELD